ncbi:L-threonylcarbamoyladenylate synthase [Gemmatimonas groenlandica]|uniref:Threonylcarbamoyl-AMP synthase n=1 Tax=Gemmatimonas groenlandica TaxID=2732249 RepID=A0A6M4ITP8_9BACT|nr:L-threonylcarbamoyladenylate synthase [Gemmatimonas groenlandica]QJR37109.1 threonylcarbamoyl-AMP synthase [Gemmatimonas groenlandica]
MAGAPILTLDPDNPDPVVVEHAAALLRRGGLVAFPTETVYGLGANALDPDAVVAIYTAKGRPAWNPVIAHVPDVAAARVLTRYWPPAADRLAAAFWPGPLTMVLPKAPQVPDVATAGLDAVALRIPAHPVALALLRAAGVPIAAPSANRFTQISPTTAQHVQASLGDRVGLILDGGPSSVGIESTVVDLTGPDAVVLRPGMISAADLELALRGSGVAVRMATVTVSHDAPTATAAPQRSPGMADRHYAPRADVWLFDAEQCSEIDAALADRRAGTGTVTALLRTTTLSVPDDTIVRMPDDPAAYARALYAALHAADATGASLIVIERPPDDDRWAGLRDRLTRAAR